MLLNKPLTVLALNSAVWNVLESGIEPSLLLHFYKSLLLGKKVENKIWGGISFFHQGKGFF